MKNAMQLKAIMKQLAKENQISAQLVLQNYMLERFLERVSLSPYRDNYIIKGGFLISSMVGLNSRATMDMDATIKGYPVTQDTVQKMIEKMNWPSCTISPKTKTIYCTNFSPMKCALRCLPSAAASASSRMASYAGRCPATPIFPAILVTTTLTVIPGIAVRTFPRRRGRRFSPPTAARSSFPAGTTATATKFCWTTARACLRGMPT